MALERKIETYLRDYAAMYEVGSNRQALRRMALVTAISVLISLVITFLAMTCVFGVDPEAEISVSQVFSFGLTMAVVVPSLICPIVCFKIVMAIRDRDRAQVELRQLADTDQLTGLLNRRGFDTAAKAAAASRHPGHLARSVLMIDIDNFKKLNDGFGHDFGDVVLVKVAAILRNAARAEGFIVARQGGEEFVALLAGTAEIEAVAIAERLRRACSQAPVEHQGKSTFVTVSIGVSIVKGHCPLGQLIADADSALYRAKQTGRNRVVLHEPVISLTRVA